MRQSDPYVVARLLAERSGTLTRHGSHIYASSLRPHCDEPVDRTVWSRAMVGFRPIGHYVGIDIMVPCRNCAKCLLVRKLNWKDRIMTETKQHQRTWFVTLTFGPKGRQMLKAAPSPDKAAMFEITDYLKRLRYYLTQAWDEARLRYIAVLEHHKDGSPHIHMLVHSSDKLQSRTFMKARWGHGFINVKLVDAEVASYLTKYLTKEVNRVRASVQYGHQVQPDEKTPKAKGDKKGGKTDPREKLDLQPNPLDLVVSRCYEGDVDLSEADAVITSILALCPSPGTASKQTSDAPSEETAEETCRSSPDTAAPTTDAEGSSPEAARRPKNAARNSIEDDTKRGPENATKVP